VLKDGRQAAPPMTVSASAFEQGGGGSRHGFGAILPIHSPIFRRPVRHGGGPPAVAAARAVSAAPTCATNMEITLEEAFESQDGADPHSNHLPAKSAQANAPRPAPSPSLRHLRRRGKIRHAQASLRSSGHARSVRRGQVIDDHARRARAPGG